MKSLSKIFILLLCIGLLCISVSAASTVESEQISATVESDGSCQVRLVLQIRLDSSQKLQFPLPEGVQNVRLNGSYKTPTVQGQQWILTLPEMGAGVHTVEISFKLSGAVAEGTGGMTLTVPLLTGLSLPMESFSFSVTLPGGLEEEPELICNWGESITSKMEIRVDGATISGTARNLLDSTELKLQCPVDRKMFPNYSPDSSLLASWQGVMTLLMAAGAIYYLLALLPSFPRKIRTFSPPEGLAAGDIGTCLTGCGMDLTMMVFSWAELGYLHIYMDRRGRVRLQKRMDMGSERSEFENKAFQKLFGSRQTVDGSSLHYALLYRKMAKKSPLLRQIYGSRSGNPRIVGILAMAAGACSGVLLAGQRNTMLGTVLLALVLALVCCGLSYLIQFGGRCIPLGNKDALWIGLGAGALWLLLGSLLGQLTLALGMVVYECLVGVAVAAGGRRSQLGKQYLAQIRGLRSHLTRGSVFDMQKCLEGNPDYFFSLMPYALALGVERNFARRFGKVKLSECAYLMTEGEENLTPAQWAALLRQVANRLNHRQKRLEYEKILQSAAKKSAPEKPIP